MKNTLNYVKYSDIENWGSLDIGSQTQVAPYFIDQKLLTNSPTDTSYDIIMAVVNGACNNGMALNIHENSSDPLYAHDATDAGASLSMMFGNNIANISNAGIFAKSASTDISSYYMGGGLQNISVSNTTATWRTNTNMTSTSDSASAVQSMLLVLSLSVGGGLLQAPVISTLDTATATDTSAGSWFDTGLTATITPTDSTSTLLIIGTITCCGFSTGYEPIFRFDRDGSPILTGDTAGSRNTSTLISRQANNALNGIPFFYTVSSGSTAETTIKLQASHQNSSTEELFINQSRQLLDNDRFKAGISQLAVYELKGVA